MELGQFLIIIIVSLAVTAVAKRLGWPAPLLVMGVALAVSLIPGVPAIEFQPEVILTIVLPPLLYSSALGISFQSFAASLVQIRRLGIYLVILTTFAVGLVANLMLPGLGLASALLIGAIVSPPDAVSATSIGHRLKLPRRVMTVIAGESLINDAAALTLLRIFLAIAGGATSSIGAGLLIFLQAIGVGVGLGLVIGFLVIWLRGKVNDATLETTIGLLVPFVAYIGAEELGGSGVLAVVAAGLVIGYNSPKLGYAARLQERPIWSALDMILEGFVFALIGLQLKSVIANVSDTEDGLRRNLVAALVVLLVVILVRPAFVFASYYLSRGTSLWRRDTAKKRWDAMDPAARAQLEARMNGGRAGRRDERRNQGAGPGRAMGYEERLEQMVEPLLTWQELIVISWTGMRGVVTLAAAASIPLAAESGIPEADRNTIFLIAFVVTIGTLLLQGLTLPLVIQWLGVRDDKQDDKDRESEMHLMRLSTEASIAYLHEHRDEFVKRSGAERVDQVIEVIQARLERELAAFEAELTDEEVEDEVEDSEREVTEYRPGEVGGINEVRLALIKIRREVVIRERDAGRVDEEVMRRVLLGLDAEELAMDTGTGRYTRR